MLFFRAGAQCPDLIRLIVQAPGLNKEAKRLSTELPELFPAICGSSSPISRLACVPRMRGASRLNGMFFLDVRNPAFSRM